MVLMKINSNTGNLAKSRVLMNGALYSSAGAYLHSLGHIPQFNLVVAYFSDSTSHDYLTFVRDNDLTSNHDSYQIVAGYQNTQYNKFLKVTKEITTNAPWIETQGEVTITGVRYTYVHAFGIQATPPVITAAYLSITTTFPELFASNQWILDNSIGYMRMGCLMNNVDIQNGGGSNIALYLQTDRIAPAAPMYYSVLTGMAAPSKVMCRDVLITTDARYFVFISYYIATNPVQTASFLSIIEIVNLTPTTYAILLKHTKLYYYQGSVLLGSIFTIIEGTPFHKLFYSLHAQYLEGRATTRAKRSGFLLKNDLQSTGTTPVVPSLNCGMSTITLSNTVIITPTAAVGWGSVPSPTSTSIFSLADDSSSYASLQSQDMPSLQVFTSGCPGSGPATPIPKYLPFIEQPLHYVIGADTLTYSGLKVFPIIENPLMSTLSACDKRVISYEIRMKDGSALPRFVNFKRSTLSFELNSPLSVAVPSEKGTFVLELVLRDIYGDFQAMDVTIIVEDALTLPPGIAACYSTANIVPNIYVDDLLYLTGTQKFNKLQTYVPRAPSYLSCESQLVLQADLVDASGTFYQNLPSFMSVDIPSRRFKVYLTRTLGSAYLDQTFTVRVRIFLKGNTTPQRSTTFKIYVTDKTQSGCIYYYKLIAPVIPDYILGANYFYQYVLPFTPFKSENDDCNSKLSIQYRAIQTYGNSLPSCMSVDFTNGVFYINTAFCPGGSIYQIRYEAWVDDPIRNIKALQISTDFTLIVTTGSSCGGWLLMNVNSQGKYADAQYSNVDSPKTINDQQAATLLLSPSSYYSPVPPVISCDLGSRIYQVGIYQDNNFAAPTFITQPNPLIHSYKIDTSQQVQANIGIYDIRIISQYYNSDMTSLFWTVTPATDYLEYHIYEESLCQIKMGNQPTSVKYQIKKVAEELIFGFNPFTITTEGCIYDRIRYNFQIAGSNSLPGFVMQDQQNVSFNISTNQKGFAGIYKMELEGSLNPKLLKAHSFDLIMELFPYANADAPKFKKSIMSPFVMTLGQEKTLTLPKIVDVDDDAFTLEVQDATSSPAITVLPTFITFDSAKNQFTFKPNDDKFVGQTKLQLVLTDQHPQPKTRIVPLIIEVQRFDLSQLQALRDLLKKNQKTNYVGVRVESVSKEAILTIAFNVSVFNEDMGIEQFNNQSLTIKMKKAFTDQTYDIPWTVQNITKNKLMIFLNFTDPQTISMYSEKDSLIVKFNKGSQLVNTGLSEQDMAIAMLSQLGNSEGDGQISELSVQYQINQNFVLNNIIPKQIIGSGTNWGALEKSANLMKGSVSGILFGNLLLNIVLSSSIQMLWGTINTLQLIVLVTLFNVSYPDNAIFMFKLIAQITRFNLIPMDQIINKLFTFDENTPINDNFATMGYESCNLLQNLDTILLFLIGIVVASVLTLVVDFILIFKPIARQKFQTVYNAVFFSTTIRIILESQIELTLSSMMNFYNMNYISTGDRVSVVLSIIIGGLMFLAPPAILLFMTTQRRKVDLPVFKAKYGSLYEGLKVQHIMHLLCNLFFTVRRILLIATTVYLSDYQGFQIMIYIFMSQFNIMYLLHYRPYEDSATNNNEIFNELCVLLVGYQLFIFTDFVDSLEVRHFTGFGLISTILLNFGINILLQLYSSLAKLPLLCRKLKNKCFSLKAQTSQQINGHTQFDTLAQLYINNDIPQGSLHLQKQQSAQTNISSTQSNMSSLMHRIEVNRQDAKNFNVSPLFKLLNETKNLKGKAYKPEIKYQNQLNKGNLPSGKKKMTKVQKKVPIINTAVIGTPKIGMTPKGFNTPDVRFTIKQVNEGTRERMKKGAYNQVLTHNQLAYQDDHIPYQFQD